MKGDVFQNICLLESRQGAGLFAFDLAPALSSNSSGCHLVLWILCTRIDTYAIMDMMFSLTSFHVIHVSLWSSSHWMTPSSICISDVHHSFITAPSLSNICMAMCDMVLTPLVSPHDLWPSHRPWKAYYRPSCTPLSSMSP